MHRILGHRKVQDIYNIHIWILTWTLTWILMYRFRYIDKDNDNIHGVEHYVVMQWYWHRVLLTRTRLATDTTLLHNTRR